MRKFIRVALCLSLITAASLAEQQGLLRTVADSVPGLVGYWGYYYYSSQNSHQITNSHAEGNVTVDASNAQVGGLVGQGYYGSITGSTSHKGQRQSFHITTIAMMFAALAAILSLIAMILTWVLYYRDRNSTFLTHGIIMIFFFLVPGIPGVLGNFLIPIMIGARDMAFPKLNLMSWYLFMIGGCFTLYVTVAGGVLSIKGGRNPAGSAKPFVP